MKKIISFKFEKIINFFKLYDAQISFIWDLIKTMVINLIGVFAIYIGIKIALTPDVEFIKAFGGVILAGLGIYFCRKSYIELTEYETVRMTIIGYGYYILTEEDKHKLNEDARKYLQGIIDNTTIGDSIKKVAEEIKKGE